MHQEYSRRKRLQSFNALLPWGCLRPSLNGVVPFSSVGGRPKETCRSRTKMDSCMCGSGSTEGGGGLWVCIVLLLYWVHRCGKREEAYELRLGCGGEEMFLDQSKHIYFLFLLVIDFDCFRWCDPWYVCCRYFSFVVQVKIKAKEEIQAHWNLLCLHAIF